MADKTLRVVAHLKGHAEKVSELQALLEGLVEPTRKEPGCISYELQQNNADPAEFTFVEEWKDDAALDAHFATGHIEHALTKLPELLADELDVRRYTLIR
jgi:quinol monooxygenase YgiN